MKRRSLGKTGLPVSEIGFGGWGIGKAMWGHTDDEVSKAALRTALEVGINFFDTAYVYGDGHSESLMAEVFAEQGIRVGHSDQVFVATKIPPRNGAWPADPRTPIQEAFPADWIISCTERSLKKLRTDCVDLQQLHVWTDVWVHEEAWQQGVERLKRDGKIKFFGVSVNDYQPESVLKLVSSGLVDTIQIIYNLFEQEPARELFPLCQKYQVGVIVRVPFDEGSLTGAFTQATTFEPGDFRHGFFGEGRLQEAIQRVALLRADLPEADQANLPQAALKFCLSHPAVSTVIPGMRHPQHVIVNAGASDQGLYDARQLEVLAHHAWRRNFYEFAWV